MERKVARTREIAEGEVSQIWTAQFQADAVFRKAELMLGVRVPVWSG